VTGIDFVFGRPGEPVMCRTIGEVSVHWWPSAEAKPGDWCLCGEMQKKAEPGDDR
jgi:hypothetical protein